MPTVRLRPRPARRRPGASDPAQPKPAPDDDDTPDGREARDDHEAADHHEALGLERIVFLSDGVFAIAMTILVLELRLPEMPADTQNPEFARALLDQLPSLLAYALSFAVLGAYWVAHWRRFQRIERATARLAWLNLLVLGLVALIPFPTALLGRYHAEVAVALYAVVLSLAGLAGTATWLYAARAGLTTPGTPTGLRDSGALRGLVVPAVFLCSLVLLPAGPTAVELSWLAIIPLARLARPRRPQPVESD